MGISYNCLLRYAWHLRNPPFLLLTKWWWCVQSHRRLTPIHTAFKLCPQHILLIKPYNTIVMLSKKHMVQSCRTKSTPFLLFIMQKWFLFRKLPPWHKFIVTKSKANNFVTPAYHLRYTSFLTAQIAKSFNWQKFFSVVTKRANFFLKMCIVKKCAEILLQDAQQFCYEMRDVTKCADILLRNARRYKMRRSFVTKCARHYIMRRWYKMQLNRHCFERWITSLKIIKSIGM